jgi:hypothetical protein
MGEELKELINKRDTILTEILRLKREQKRLLKEHYGKSEEYYATEDALFMLREDLEDITKKMVEVLEKTLSEKSMLCFKFNNLRQVRNYLMLLKIKPEAPLKPARGYYIIRLWKRDKQIRESLELEEIKEGEILGEDLVEVYYKDRRRLRKILKFIARNKLSLREL